MKEKDNVDDGIGVPDLQLSLFLLAAWVIIFIVNIKGIKSSGKVSYFLAIFPYCVLFTLLVKASMLEGALEGIKYFIKPNFSKLLDPMVSYKSHIVKTKGWITYRIFSAIKFNFLLNIFLKKFLKKILQQKNFCKLSSPCTHLKILGLVLCNNSTFLQYFDWSWKHRLLRFL